MSDAPKKIVRIIARLNMGGPAKHVAWLSAGLQPEFETVLVAGKVGENEIDISDFSRRLGVQPQMVDSLGQALGPRDLKAFIDIFKIIWKENPDAVATHTAKAGFLGRAAAKLVGFLKRKKIYAVHTFHGHVFFGYWGPRKTKLFLILERLMARFSDRIIVLSQQQLDEINGHFGVGKPEQFLIIPLGLDLSPFTGEKSPPASSLLLQENQFLVGSAGRLTGVKNYGLIIEGLRELPTEVVGVIAGEGEDGQSLAATAQQIHLQDRFHLIGPVKDLMSFYPYLDLFILTSVNEGTPLAMIEAMSCGIPVLSSRVGGIVDLLGPVQSKQGQLWVHERGLSFESGDISGFREGITLAMKDRQGLQERMEKARTFILKQASVDRLIHDQKKLYLELTGKPPQ